LFIILFRTNKCHSSSYNLGVKLGAKGLVKEEMKMYAKATKADKKFGGAWLNWGTALAEQGNMDDVSFSHYEYCFPHFSHS
jgi:hypothetical protein